MAKNKSSIEFDLDDPRSEKIAAVLSSATAKKVLNYLSEAGEMSGSDLAEKLNMPLNTVIYNLKKLEEAGLVEKAKRFFWSSKGKRIELYRVSNRKIIISPKMMTQKIVASFLVIGVLLAVALVYMASQNSEVKFLNDDSLKQFRSLDEMTSFLEENSGASQYGGFARAGVAESFAAEDSGAIAPSKASDGATDYSTTNIQVQGVDEPDIVKNDGKYIYKVSGKKIVIVEAFPAEEMKVLSEIDLEDYARNIFVNGDKLIVFSDKYEYIDTGLKCFGDYVISRCGGYSREKTLVNIYDVSDRENPELEDEIELSGNYVDARMIGDFVYLISSKYVYFNGFETPFYRVNDVEKIVAPEEIYYFDSSDENYVFNSISAIDLENGDVNTEVYLMGATTSIYVSEDNIYLTYMKRINQKVYFERYVDEVVLPLLPSDEDDKVEEAMKSDDLYEASREIDGILQNYVISLGSREGSEFMKEYEDLSLEFSEEINKEFEKTVVHKISIDGSDINYEVKGEVPGTVLNQFSMDEFEGNFRIATMTGNTWDESSLNNLYVLNEDLEIVGSVEDLAEGERIYSTRFIGDRAYMVTFRQVDPLYVIDLSDAENPEVLGYLKVTGYSSYLHPYDENHIIGVGQEADENGRTTGVKISLFDVSDVANPREVGKYTVDEGMWSYSEALYDHKAFLFDKEKELLVIPVSYSDQTESWQGAYVLKINLDGISLKGKIDHETGEKTEYYYGGDYVQRSLFMDDVLYTVSNAKVKSNSLTDLTEIKEVDLPFEDYPVIYFDEGPTVTVK